MLVVKVYGFELSEYVNVYYHSLDNCNIDLIEYIEMISDFEYSQNLKSIFCSEGFNYSFFFNEEYRNCQYKSNITNTWLNDGTFLFEFDNEEEALYFKLKYCSD